MGKPYGLAIQKLCYIPICKSWRKRQRMFLRMVGEYETWSNKVADSEDLRSDRTYCTFQVYQNLAKEGFMYLHGALYKPSKHIILDQKH